MKKGKMTFKYVAGLVHEIYIDGEHIGDVYLPARVVIEMVRRWNDVQSNIS